VQLDITAKLRELGYVVLENNRKLIAPYELDLVLPDLGLAIEVNGVRFHNTSMKPAGYHLMKRRRTEQAGLKLMQITDAEWYGQQAVVWQNILVACGHTRPVLSTRTQVVWDLRLPVPDALIEHGFSLVAELPPAEFYIHLNGEELRPPISPAALKKHDPTLSLAENLRANNFWCIEDAGHAILQLN
jgi:hypothetical protein